MMNFDLCNKKEHDFLDNYDFFEEHVISSSEKNPRAANPYVYLNENFSAAATSSGTPAEV